MNWQEITSITAAVIVSIGGAGGIIIGCSNYLGQLLAKRFEEKIKAKFQKEINEYQNKLDIIKQMTLRYSDRQFEAYSKLWASLYDLKILADDLWEEASPAKLESFASQLRAVKAETEKASLFIEEAHYGELIQLLKEFSNYQLGKLRLIDFREIGMNYYSAEIHEMIRHNGQRKAQYEQLIILIRKGLKKQLRG